MSTDRRKLFYEPRVPALDDLSQLCHVLVGSLLESESERIPKIDSVLSR